MADWFQQNGPATPSAPVIPPEPTDRFSQNAPTQTTTTTPTPKPGLLQGANDEDIIKHYGYNPEVIKKAHLYSHGDLQGFISDPTRTDIVSKLADSPLGDLGEGVVNTGNGIAQFATHVLNKVGIASDSDTQYMDLLTKLQRDNYEQNVRRGKPHSEASEVVAPMLVPVPGGPAESLIGAAGKGAAVGATAAAAQPVETTGPNGSYFGKKAAQVTGGAAVGALTGGILHTAGSTVAKVINAKTTKLPEEIATDLQAKADVSAADARKAAEDAAGRILQEKALAQQAADDAAGRVTQAKAASDATKRAARTTVTSSATNAQKAVADLATQKAEVATRSAEAEEAAENAAQTAATGVGTNASLATSALRTTMGDTQFHGTQELTDAAATGDGRAGAVLKQLQDAGDNPDKIQQASIQLQNWRTRQAASVLYDHVGELAEKHAPGDVPLDATEDAVERAIGNAESAKIPDKSLISTLNTIKNNIGAGVEDGVVDNSYAAIRRFDDDLGTLIRSGQKGANALVNDTSVPVLSAVRQAVRADLEKFTQSVPELQQAAKTADEYYKTVRVPFKRVDIAGAATNPDADRIYDGFIRAGSGDKAQRYYDALDPKGRAAVRYQMATDAINAATDPIRGTFDPAKFYHALNDLSDAHGIFFKGSEKGEMDGLKKFAQRAALAQDATKTAASAVIDANAAKLAAARQRVFAARAAVQRARSQSATQLDAAQRTLADETARANAMAEDFARASAVRQMQFSAKAEDVARIARQHQDTADLAHDAIKEAKAIRDKYPLGKTAAGLAGAAEIAALAHMPGTATVAGGMSILAATMKFLTQTDAGRRYLSASASLKLGSAGMQKLLNLVMQKAQVALATQAAKPSEEPTQ